MNTRAASEKSLWLFSRRADFWLACGGASGALLAAVLLILWHGDRELDALDFVLSEFHLGATYDAIIRRRLWRHRQADVLLIPLLILALTYGLSMGSQTILLTSVAMYAAVWHRGRQSFGVARFYQRQCGGPVSRAHDWLFRGAIYLPMLAATLAYTHLAPAIYEEKPYFAIDLGAQLTSLAGLAATAWVIVYLAWALRQTRGNRLDLVSQRNELLLHPGERWVVLANAVAFGSGYALGASNVSFLLVLAVHHEVQYLYFTCAMARRGEDFQRANGRDAQRAVNDFHSTESIKAGAMALPELKFAVSFLVWPVIGFSGAVAGGWLQLQWLAPLGIGGLFCHYWFDARIWTRRSFQN